MSAPEDERVVSRKQAAAEVAVWVALAALYVAGSLLDVPVRWVFVVLGVALVAYFAVIVRRGREGLRHFGLGREGLARASVATAVFTAVAAAGFVAYARLRGVALWRPELAILLPLYPIYGLAQQLAVQGILHRRLQVLTRSRALCVLATALAFGLLHVGKPLLFGLTAAGGLGWALLFQRYHNLWPLGVSHGVLAALAYPLVLGENPLSQL